jgi:hypothetical protein
MDDNGLQHATCHECGYKFAVPILIACPNGHRAFWDYDSWRRASAAKDRRIAILEAELDAARATVAQLRQTQR